MIDEYIKNWLIKANNDLKAVEHELSLPKDEVLPDIVCFHCQQAVEKYLKAFLIYHNVEFAFVHDLNIYYSYVQLLIKNLQNLKLKIYPDLG